MSLQKNIYPFNSHAGFFGILSQFMWDWWRFSQMMILLDFLRSGLPTDSLTDGLMSTFSQLWFGGWSASGLSLSAWYLGVVWKRGWGHSDKLECVNYYAEYSENSKAVVVETTQKLINMVALTFTLEIPRWNCALTHEFPEVSWFIIVSLIQKLLSWRERYL